MPQPYTYCCAAQGVWKLIFETDELSPSTRLGALGTMPLRCYNLFHRKHSDALALAADEIETQNCGDFLDALISEAKTENERDYAMGFLVHYAADCTLRPYLAAVSKNYKARVKLEAALDTYFHAKEIGVAYVPCSDVMPNTDAALQTEICALVKRAAFKAYGEELSMEMLCDALYECKRLFKLQCSPSNKNGFKIFLTDMLLVKRKGYVKNRTTPMAPPKKGFAVSWQNPYTTAAFSDNGPDVLMRQCVRAATGYIHTARKYWANGITLENMRLVIGSNVYETGLPCD